MLKRTSLRLWVTLCVFMSVRIINNSLETALSFGTGSYIVFIYYSNGVWYLRFMMILSTYRHKCLRGTRSGAFGGIDSANRMRQATPRNRGIPSEVSG